MSISENDINILEQRLRCILDALGWNYEKLIEEDPGNRVVCPFNDGHILPKSSPKEHIATCSWKSEGYLLEDRPLSDSTPCASSVLLTVELQETILREAALANPLFVTANCDRFLVLYPDDINILLHCKIGGDFQRPIPKTSNRLQLGFTQDERLAIYNYVVEKTKRNTELKDVGFIQNESKPEVKEMTELELKAAERDAKRRRATYRNKVHTSNKNHVEVLREVIQSQMTQFCEELKADGEITEEPISSPQRKPLESRPGKAVNHGRDYHEHRLRNERQGKYEHRDKYYHNYRDDRSYDYYDQGPSSSTSKDRSSSYYQYSDHYYGSSSTEGGKAKSGHKEFKDMQRMIKTDVKHLERIGETDLSGSERKRKRSREKKHLDGEKDKKRRRSRSNESRHKRKKERKHKKEKKRKKKKRSRSSSSSSSSSSA